MTVTKLCELCSLTAVNIADGEREVDGVYCCDLLSWVMGKATADDAWITIMSNINVIAVAQLTDVSCVILAEGVTLDDEALKTAQQKGINVLSSKQSVYSLCLSLGKML